MCIHVLTQAQTNMAKWQPKQKTNIPNERYTVVERYAKKNYETISQYIMYENKSSTYLSQNRSLFQ